VVEQGDHGVFSRSAAAGTGGACTTTRRKKTAKNAFQRKKTAFRVYDKGQEDALQRKKGEQGGWTTGTKTSPMVGPKREKKKQSNTFRKTGKENGKLFTVGKFREGPAVGEGIGFSVQKGKRPWKRPPEAGLHKGDWTLFPKIPTQREEFPRGAGRQRGFGRGRYREKERKVLSKKRGDILATSGPA